MARGKARLASLVEDYGLYPRHAVDGSHVAGIARAVRAGCLLPPPTVDRKSKRIVDGFHRCRAWRKVLGEDGEIEVDYRDYPDETAMLEAAVELNAPHGRKFDKQDQTKAVLMLQERGVDVVRIATLLRTEETQVRRLLTRVVIVRQDDGDPVVHPAKPVIYPGLGEAPKQITPQQYTVMRSSSGYTTAQTVTQLTAELEAGLVDVAGLAVKLWRLAEVIRAKVPKPKSA